MPKTLAQARIKLTVLDEAPADLFAITAAELAAGTDIQCRIMKSDYRLSPSGSDTNDQTELCTEGNAVTFGNSNYEAILTVFRYFTGLGASEVLNDIAWPIFKQKGTQLWLVEREGPRHDVAWATADEYSAFEVITDDPQVPTDRAGYIRRTIPLGVQNAALNKVVVAGGGGGG